MMFKDGRSIVDAHMVGELSAIKKFLEDLPPSSVIERTSLEARKNEIEAKLKAAGPRKAGNCFICGKELNYLWSEDVNAKNIDDGGDVEFSFHYGSRHDTFNARAIICDECMTKIINEKKFTEWRDMDLFCMNNPKWESVNDYTRGRIKNV